MSAFADNLARRLAARDPVPAPAEVRQAAVAIVLRDAPQLDVLLMTRAERAGDRWSGQVSLPGGHAEDEDPDLCATAIRETREELGVDLTACARPLGRLNALQARARGGLLPLYLTPFVFIQTRVAQVVVGDEARDAFRLPLAHAAGGALDADYDYPRDDVIVKLPSWRFEERVVWGMTHRILTELLDAGDGLWAPRTAPPEVSG